MSAVRKVLVALSTSAIVAGSIAATAAPASAAVGDCASGRGCSWTSIQYPGSPNASFTCNIYGYGSSNNLTKSVVNNGTSAVTRWFDLAGYSGTNFGLNNPARGGVNRDSDLSNGTDGHAGVNYSNLISSARFETSGC